MVKGDGNNLRPQINSTRAETVQIMYNLLFKLRRYLKILAYKSNTMYLVKRHMVFVIVTGEYICKIVKFKMKVGHRK